MTHRNIGFPDDTEWVTSRAILCPTNDKVDSINCYLLHNVPGDSRVYKISDKIKETDLRYQYPQELFNSLCPSGIPSHKLVLKEKVPIMLLRNMDPYNGHCNATKYVVNHLNDHVIDATVASGIQYWITTLLSANYDCAFRGIIPIPTTEMTVPVSSCIRYR